MKSIILTLLILVSFESIAQEFDPSGKIYNKHTGKKISDKEFGDYIRNNPNVLFENVINKYGEVEKYLLDTTSRTPIKRTGENQIQPGAEFPEFVFKSVKGEEIASSNLKGQWVIVSFELFLKMINKSSYVAFDQKLSSANNEKGIVVISCFLESQKEVMNTLGTDVSNIHLISDAINFHKKYDIVRTPTIILLDPQGKVVGYFNNWLDIDVNNLIRK